MFLTASGPFGHRCEKRSNKNLKNVYKRKKRDKNFLKTSVNAIFFKKTLPLLSVVTQYVKHGKCVKVNKEAFQVIRRATEKS